MAGELIGKKLLVFVEGQHCLKHRMRADSIAKADKSFHRVRASRLRILLAEVIAWRDA